jgi:hypothetical protein
MAFYVVMEPPEGTKNPADEAVFIRDGFAFLGFLIPPFWLLWNKLWIEAAFAVLAALAIAAIGQALGLGLTGQLLSLLVSIYVGLEGQNMRIAALRRKGWREWGALEAASVPDAEIRYLSAADFPEDKPIETVTITDKRTSPAATRQPSLGLLQYPGGR